MKCVMYNIDGNNLNYDGALINAIEYFLYLYELDKNIKLVLIGGEECHIDEICKLSKERYVLDGIEDFRDNIMPMKISQMVRVKFDKVLILNAGVIKRVKGLLVNCRITIVSDRFTDNPDYMLTNDIYDVVYYGEMPFEYRDIDYKMKFLFHRYKTLENVKNHTYVSTHDISVIDNMRGQYGLIFRDSDTSRENFFSEFDKLLYIVDRDRCDPSPRLFLECKFYGKDVEYVNPCGIKDGSWYRYQAYIHEDIKCRYFTPNDYVIREMI